VTMAHFLRLKTLENLPPSIQTQICGGIVAIGNFDGVHRGHQAVLEAALHLAHCQARPAFVLTFEPHPKSFFCPSRPVDRLTQASDKAEIFRALGFAGTIELVFDQALSSLTAQDFINQVLIGSLGCKAVVTGDNFHFGTKKGGNPQMLQMAGRRAGFEVKTVPGFHDENGEMISSSRIREKLAQGAVEEAAGLLGYRYRISAKVVHGDALGRTLGFPTANMCVPAQTGLKIGIYGVRLRRADGGIFDGVASFGYRPTVSDSATVPLLETHIFDFDDDLYGEICSVSFVSYLRGEKKFDGLEALVAQMRCDEIQARACLATITPLSSLDKMLTFTDKS